MQNLNMLPIDFHNKNLYQKSQMNKQNNRKNTDDKSSFKLILQKAMDKENR